MKSGYEYPTMLNKNFVVNDELIELMKSIQNRCVIFLAICEFGDISHTLPTLLEDMIEDCQEMAEKYCVVEDD